MPAYIRLPCLLCAALSLSACAPMLALVGTNQTLVQIVAQVERVKLAGDGVSFVTSSKTITDHALSIAVGKDCKLFNVISPDPVCTDKNANTQVRVSLAPEAAAPAQSDVQTGVEADAANIAPGDQSAGDE